MSGPNTSGPTGLAARYVVLGKRGDTLCVYVRDPSSLFDDSFLSDQFGLGRLTVDKSGLGRLTVPVKDLKAWVEEKEADANRVQFLMTSLETMD